MYVKDMWICHSLAELFSLGKGVGTLFVMNEGRSSPINYVCFINKELPYISL